MEVTFTGHVQSLLEAVECSAMTWMQDNDGQWRVTENMVGGLWALEDTVKRLVAAVRKSAGYDAADIKDDGGRNQIRDIEGSEEMEGTYAGETNGETGAENVSGDICVLGLGRKTATSQTSLDMQLMREARG